MIRTQLSGLSGSRAGSGGVERLRESFRQRRDARTDWAPQAAEGDRARRAAGQTNRQANKQISGELFISTNGAPRGSLLGVAVRPPSRKGTRNARQGQRRLPPKCNRSPIRAGRARPPPLGASLPPCGGGFGGSGRTFPNVSSVMKPKFQWSARPPIPRSPPQG